MGINIMALGLLGFAAGYLERMVFKGNILVPILSILAGTILYESLVYSIQSAFGWRIEFWPFLCFTVFPLCFYHLVLTGPVYFGINKGLSFLQQKVKVGG